MQLLKKLALTFFISTLFVLASKELKAQCQLCYLNAEQSQKAITYLNRCKEIVLYSACERGDIARRVRITKAYAKKADRKGYFTTWIEGVTVAIFDISPGNGSVQNYTTMNTKIDEEVDLAYLHTRNTARLDETTGRIIWDSACLGIFLGFDCKPCTDPFDYPSQPLKN